MSIESAREFIERMKTDMEFREKVSKAKDKDERKKFVAAAGYDFHMNEIKELTGEISEQDLDSISGGHYGCCNSDPIGGGSTAH